MKFGGKICVTATVLALAGCALPPSNVTPQKIAQYEAAVASIGCVMRYDSDYLPVELQAGLTREQTLAITKYELAADRAVSLPDGGVKLTTGACA